MPSRDDGDRKQAKGINRQVLEGHIRQKKKLVPPIVALPQSQFVSSMDYIFPEIVWVGLLLERYGVSAGIAIVSDALTKLWALENEINWYRFSEIAQHDNLLNRALGQPLLDQLNEAFSPLLAVYGWEGFTWCSKIDGANAEEVVSASIRKYSDRVRQPYMTILATLIYSMTIAERIIFTENVELPDFEAIVSDWSSDNADKAAATLRACSMAFFPSDQTRNGEEWCRHFWRVNYTIGDCEFI